MKCAVVPVVGKIYISNQMHPHTRGANLCTTRKHPQSSKFSTGNLWDSCKVFLVIDHWGDEWSAGCTSASMPGK